MNIQAAVEAYLENRRTKEAIAARHKEELAPVNDWIRKMEMLLLRALNEQGGQHFACKAGTVYKTERTSVSVKDWPVALEFIKDNELWQMLNRAVSKTAVEEYMEEHGGQLPPGLDLRRDLTVNVRSARGETKP
jgi:hypothetical protein